MEKTNKLTIPPRELKTVEIDVEHKRFLVNGEDFGKDARGFVLSCSTSHSEECWFNVCLEIITGVKYSSGYDLNGKMTSNEERHPKGSDAAND